MNTLPIGGNTELLKQKFTLNHPLDDSVGISIFCLGPNGKVLNDDGMVFNGMPNSPCGTIKLLNQAIEFDLSKAPSDIEKFTITATLDNKATWQQSIVFDSDDFNCTLENTHRTEKALILLHIYKRHNIWKVRFIGQGFNDGLAPLVSLFGIEIDNVSPPQLNLKSIKLKNNVIELNKKAKIEIEKKGLKGAKSQVVLVLDISKSMNRLFKDGAIQELIQRILGLALTFDNDSNIDLMLFGTRAYQLPSVSLDDLEGYVEREIIANYRIIEATKYATALNLIKEKYKGNKDDPVFVIFVTDGSNSDKKESTELITSLSKESVFIQFVGIGKETFPYLNKLDELPNRFLDNVGFMHVNDIASIDDASLYDRLLNEYPEWLKKAALKGIL